MKIGYLKNTTADIGKGLSFASLSIKPTVNTPGSTNYSNKNQCWTHLNLKYLIMMLITETRYCTTALISYCESMTGTIRKYGNYTQRAEGTLNQNQHDQSAEQRALVGTR